MKIRASRLEQPRAEVVADPVADLGAHDGGDERAEHHDGQVEVRVARLGRGAEGPGQEEDGVAGEGDRDQARLDEHHQDEAGRAEGLDEVLGAEPVHGDDHGRGR